MLGFVKSLIGAAVNAGHVVICLACGRPNAHGWVNDIA
jgi:hypothetical protein